MKGITKVNVLIKWEDNRIKCICLKDSCEPDEVTHDKYYGIKECFSQNKYGK